MVRDPATIRAADARCPIGVKNVLAPAVLMLASCVSTAERALTPNDPDTPAGVVAELYDLVTFDAGTTPDWNEVRSLFVDEAVIVLRTGREEMSVFSLEDFVADFVDFLDDSGVEETGFTERILGMKAFVYGDIAQVLVRFESFIPGSDREPREGIDSFELVRREGRWRIVAVTNERPTRNNPIPVDAFE